MEGLLPEEMDATEEENASLGQALDDAGESERQAPPSPLDDEPTEKEQEEVKAEADEGGANAEDVKAEGEADTETDTDVKADPEPTEQDKHTKGILKELSREREARAESDRKMAKVLEALDKQQKANAEPEPDRDLDPDAYADFHKARADAAVEQQGDSQKEITAQQEADKVTRYTTDSVSDFMADHPDYSARFEFVKEQVISELVKSGNYSVETAPAQFQALVSQKTSEIYNNKGNPAQYVFQQSELMGYKAPAASTEAAKPPAVSDAAMRDAEKLQAGQTTSKSLGKGGGAGNDSLTWKTLSDMSGEEFDEGYDKLTGNNSGYGASIE